MTTPPAVADLFGELVAPRALEGKKLSRATIAEPSTANYSAEPAPLVYAGKLYASDDLVAMFGAGADVAPLTAAERAALALAYNAGVFRSSALPVTSLEIPRLVVDLPAQLAARFHEAARRAAEGSPAPAPGIPRWLAAGLPEPGHDERPRGSARPNQNRTTAPASDPGAPVVGGVLALTRIEFPPPVKSLDVRHLRAVVKNHCRRLWPRNSNGRKCGLRRFGSSVQGVTRRVMAGNPGHEAPRDRAHVAGLIRCANVHSCPTCNATISSHRATIVSAIVGAHVEATRTPAAPLGAVYMLTLTVPHDVGMRCRRLRKTVSAAWQRVQRGAPWARLKNRMRFVGSITAREVTHGGNGFHPHLHILLALERPLSDVELHNLEVALFIRWCDALECVPGFRGALPSWEHGITLGACHKRDYIVKLGLAAEVTRGGEKRGRRDNRTPFQIMGDYSRLGRATDAAIIREYIRGMKGARQLTYSRGKNGATDLRQIYAAELAALAARAQESLPGFETDAELVAAEERDGTVVTTMPGRRWDALARVMRSAGRCAEWELTAAIEAAGVVGVDALFGEAATIARRLVTSGERPYLRKWLPWLAPPSETPASAAYKLPPREWGGPGGALAGGPRGGVSLS